LRKKKKASPTEIRSQGPANISQKLHGRRFKPVGWKLNKGRENAKKRAASRGPWKRGAVDHPSRLQDLDPEEIEVTPKPTEEREAATGQGVA